MGMFGYPTSASGKPAELGKYYLLYRCPGCGSEGLSELTLERASRWSLWETAERRNMREYLGSTQQTNSGESSRRGSGAGEREAALRDLKRRLEEGDWSPVVKKVVCERCRAVQPWSGMGKPWQHTLLAILTAAAALITIIELRIRLGDPTGRSGDPILALVPCGVMVLLSLGYVLGRRKRLADQRRSRENRPEFYLPEELRELAEGPYGDMVKPYLKK